MIRKRTVASCCFLLTLLLVAVPGASPGQTFEIVQAFRSEGDPQGALVETGGFFYGTTRLGGEHGLGTVFKVDGAGTRTTLHEFAGPEGAYPQDGATVNDYSVGHDRQLESDFLLDTLARFSGKLTILSPALAEAFERRQRG